MVRAHPTHGHRLNSADWHTAEPDRHRSSAAGRAPHQGRAGSCCEPAATAWRSGIRFRPSPRRNARHSSRSVASPMPPGAARPRPADRGCGPPEALPTPVRQPQPDRLTSLGRVGAATQGPAARGGPADAARRGGRVQNEAYVRFVDVQKTYDGDTLVVRDLNLDVARGEFLTLLGPSGSGKTTCLMMLAGFEAADPWRDHPRRPADQQRPAVPARHRHGVPELRAVPAHDGRREPGVPARGAQSRAGRDRGAGQAGARHGPAGGLRAAPAGPALGRPAAAGRGRARARVRAQAGPDGRAARRARQAAARADAVRDQAPPRASGRDRGLRHPRPVRGADHVGPHRGVQPWA